MLVSEKIEKVIDFYMLANSLKYKNKYDFSHSVADHIYGVMILAYAINSEYDVFEDLGKVLRLILFSELNSDSKDLFLERLNGLNKGKKYINEISPFDCDYDIDWFIMYCKSLELNLNKFFDDFLVCNNKDDYKILYRLSVDLGYFVNIYDDNNKNMEIFRFYYLNYTLRNKIRSGWDVNHWNIKKDRIENVSEHVVGAIALAIAFDSEFDFGIDIDEVISTLCIHEIGEIKIGDITPFDGVSLDEKRNIEHKAVVDVIGNLSKKDDMINLIFSFDARNNPNARFAYFCDKLEADIQSKVYQDMGCHNSLDNQENNIVFKSDKVRKMVMDGAKEPFDIWYFYDKDIYKNSFVFSKALKYIKSRKLI